MSGWLLGLVTACYFGTAIDLWLNHKPGLSVMFGGYAIANFGLLYDLYGQKINF